MRFILFFIFFFSFASRSLAQSIYDEPTDGNVPRHSTSIASRQSEGNSIKAETSEKELSPNRTLLAYFLGTAGGTIIGSQIGLKIAGKKNVDHFPLGIAVGLLVAAVPAIEGDNLSLSFRTVYGNYKMDKMKNTVLQSSPQLSNLNLPYTVTDDFPASVGYELAFSGAINKWTIGTKIGYKATRGRFGYRDTTGEVSFENRTKLLEITEFVKYSLIKTGKLNVTLGLNLGAGRTMETRETKIGLDDGEKENYDDRSTSLNLFFGPELMAHLLLTKHLRIEAFGGYDSHIFTGLNAGVNNLPENAGNPDWSGVRMGLGIGWVFN